MIALPLGSKGHGFGRERFVRETYLILLQSLGLKPFLLAPSEMHDLDLVKRNCSGLMLMGGTDVNPRLYNESAHAKTGEPDTDRDALESALIELFLSLDRPILGICRGCQILNVTLGGSLHQHIPDLGSDVNHDSATYEDLSKNFHKVSFVPGTNLQEIVGKTEAMVNTRHHQAIRNVSPALRTAALAQDGGVEAIEHPTQFCFGVQSHPEMDLEGAYRPLLQAFAAAASKK